jgi:hypothetical protein
MRKRLACFSPTTARSRNSASRGGRKTRKHAPELAFGRAYKPILDAVGLTRAASKGEADRGRPALGR